jgi:serine O-acetyltransferase
LLRAIRAYQAARGRWRPLRWFAGYWVLQHRFWSVVTGADIPLNAQIGGGLMLPHPNGVVIHPGARIGPNCLLFQQVTIGFGGRKPGVPTLGGHVDVGAGAKLLGGITIGDHAIIGANAVVLDDVPPGATAVGIPARIVSRPAPAVSAPPADGTR